MKRIFQFVPNLLTLLNLLLGSIAVMLAYSGSYKLAAWFIVVAAICDFLDGTTARLLDAKSDIGKELDSLADVVSFGLAPAIVLYSMLATVSGFEDSGVIPIRLSGLPALLIVAFSALRLARFNIDPLQSENFSGLPTPANALFIITLPLIRIQGAASKGLAHTFSEWLGNYYVLLGLTGVLCYLLISGLPFMGFKIKELSFRKNGFRIALLITAIALFLLFGIASAPIILLLYLVLSLLHRRQSV